MDWQTFASGIRGWAARHGGMAVEDVLWKGEPGGWVGRPCALLTVLAHAAVDGTDEARIVAQGPGEDACVRLTGHRTFTLSCQVRTRDHRPGGHAYAVLERIRDALYLPSTQELFGALGVGLVGTLALVDQGRTFDQREESVAVLDLRLSAAVDVLAQDEHIGTIEQVRFGGSAGPVTSPERLIP